MFFRKQNYQKKSQFKAILYEIFNKKYSWFYDGLKFYLYPSLPFAIKTNLFQPNSSRNPFPWPYVLASPRIPQ